MRDSDYESSFFLHKTLKMRNLGDLYNAQNVILLWEIAENGFQFMHDQYGFNPRKGYSASALYFNEKCHVLLLHYQPLMKQLISLNKQ